MMTKRTYRLLLFALSVMLLSCAPVLDRSYMAEGERQVSFQALRENPDQYKGALYVLGGVIVHTKFTEAGSQIEALHVPVDHYGYFEDTGRSEGRFLAVLSADRTMLDPVVFDRGRKVTLAGEFSGTRKGKIDEMEYVYPVFMIKQIYLWPKEEYYYPPPYYYDPWFYPYPYYYRYPWWRYPHYIRTSPPLLYGRSPLIDRSPPLFFIPAPKPWKGWELHEMK